MNRPNGISERERFFTLSLDMLCIASFDGFFVDLNPAWERTLGFTIDELKAKPFIDFVHPDDQESTIAEAETIMATGKDVVSFENRYQCKDGGYRWILWSATVSLEKRLYYAVGRDVTRRKQTDDALEQEQSLLSTFMDNTPDHIYFKDMASRFIRINKAVTKLFHLTDAEEAIGKSDADFFTEEHAQQAFADEQQVMKSGAPMEAKEEKETWPTGQETWVSTTKAPLYETSGKIIGTFGISRDITERVHAQAELR
ncbi:MAG: PAS domain-containing protein, partial [Candidatus Poribacteria bacterium]|nr:PAS domain-containing protein [Candidatus Poribacteria bacterium]